MTDSGHGPKTVILVEQDVASRDAFQTALSDAGFTVLCFPDYVGPLDIAESDRRLDLLITRVRLPAGTPHGVSLAAMIHRRRPRLPVLFIVDDSAQVRLTGDEVPVLVKPIAPSELILVAAQLIGESRSS